MEFVAYIKSEYMPARALVNARAGTIKVYTIVLGEFLAMVTALVGLNI